MILEVCCGSYEDALIAYENGAKRVELNSALYLGGLTPTLGSLRLIKENCPDLEVISMVRPRGAGFCYSGEDISCMLMDAEILMNGGSDGIVFGFLNEDHTIDTFHTKMMVSLIKEHHKLAVFHRAFDCVKDPYEAIETLIDLGIDRILTSGLQPTAIDGKDLIKDLQAKYGDKIEILPGSGINATNVADFIKYTDVKQVHSSCKGNNIDVTSHYGNVDFSYAKSNCYEAVQANLVKSILNVLEEF